MRILLAGGSGVLGQLAAKDLTAEGHQVSGLGRGAGNAIRADLLDREAVLRAVDGRAFDVVIHAATGLNGKSLTRHRDMYPTNALRDTGTRNLIEAARATGAKRFVAESMVLGYGYRDHGRSLHTEADLPFGPTGGNAQLERHLAAMRTKEELTLGLGAEGIEGIALRLGLFYGPGVTETVVVPPLRKRALPAPPERGLLLPWVSVADAAAALCAAVQYGRAGEAYNIVDDVPLSFGGHMRVVAEAFGAPKPMTVPLWLLRAAPLAHACMSTNLRLSNAKAKAELHWKPASPNGPEAVRALALALARQRPS